MTTLTIAGTAADDTIVITATGSDSGSYCINGGSAVDFSGVTQVVVTGEDGNDTLTIVNPDGALFAPTNGISYDGGNEPADGLEVLGGTANDLTYMAGATPDAGTLTHNGDAGTQSIDFAGIAPITDTVAAATPHHHRQRRRRCDRRGRRRPGERISDHAGQRPHLREYPLRQQDERHD